MMQLLRALFFGIVTILAGGVALLIIGAPFAWYAESGTYEAYSTCQMRRIENKVPDDISNVHTDYCMVSLGYRRYRCISTETYLPTCYVSRWFAWAT